MSGSDPRRMSSESPCTPVKPRIWYRNAEGGRRRCYRPESGARNRNMQGESGTITELLICCEDNAGRIEEHCLDKYSGRLPGASWLTGDVALSEMEGAVGVNAFRSPRNFTLHNSLEFPAPTDKI